MNKIKYYLVGSIIGFVVFGGIIFLAKSAEAETSTTFPVDEAGIAAYVKLDSVDITDLTEALNFYYSIEKQGETYVIGTVKITHQLGNWPYWSDYPHVYIGLDGWIVAYYSKDQEASRIMQWKGYEKGKIETTTLKEAIDYMCGKIGVTYSTPDVKYYDFEFPDANKLTLIAETGNDNSFSVTIPGTLYEGSYSAYTGGGQYHTWTYRCPVLDLFVDGLSMFLSPEKCWARYYGYYDISYLATNIPHLIHFTCSEKGGGVATVLIYKSQ